MDVEILPAARNAPFLLVLHGLEGSSEAGYVRTLLRGAAEHGWGAVAMNFRSCGREPNCLPRSYHSGETGDARFVLSRAGELTRGPWGAVGFSLGGNVLLRLLSEVGGQTPFLAAAAVSVPYDLQACARALDTGKGFVALYRYRFLRTLKKKALAKARRFPELFRPGEIRRARGIEAFDEVVTSRLHGFAGARDYYEKCSSGPALEAIRTPTLLLSAMDDPLVPAPQIPESARKNSFLKVVLTEHGGHNAFVAGSVLAPRYWAQEQVLTFLHTRLATS